MVRELDTVPPRRLFIDGPAGRLHATFERPTAEPRAAVLHLHPHPLHGGTRQNNVVRHGALGSLAAGCAALRIDFRGVGQSEGKYDEGDGEVDDAAAAFAWLAAEVPGVPVFVWGFSFGSRVGLEYSIREVAAGKPPAGYMGVAWPTKFYAWPHGESWPERASFLAGSADEYVNLAAMNRVEKQSGLLQVVDGATHFFPGQLDEVSGWTQRQLEVWLSG
jgi:uncharacterized protein